MTSPKLVIGVNIWQGESPQVAATSGVPGSSAAGERRLGRRGSRDGAALTPQGR